MRLILIIKLILIYETKLINFEIIFGILNALMFDFMNKSTQIKTTSSIKYDKLLSTRSIL